MSRALPGPFRFSVRSPVGILTLYFAAVLGVLSASRIGLSLLYVDELRSVPDAWRLFPIGVRLDVMTLSPLLLPAAPLVLLWPQRGRHALGWIVGTYLGLATAVMVLLEVATPAFLAEYGSRPNGILIDYLGYPREVVPTVWAEQGVTLAAALAAAALVGAVIFRTVRRAISVDRSSPWPARVVMAPLVVLLLFGGARSTLTKRPGNLSTAAFSGDHFANELALNSTYAVAYALYEQRHEADPGSLYGRLPPTEALARVRRGMLLPPEAFPDPELPLLHRQEPSVARAAPLNLVVFLQESLDAGFVGSLGGEPLTPNLDRLADEGVFFTNLFATGTRTVRGIEAVVTGLPPTPSSSVVKLGLAQGGFFTLADLLRRHGYATEFFYGGASNFDNMRGFFLNDGFARVVDEGAFEAPVFRGTWGVSDEDLVRRAHETFVAHGSQPFFALMLSTSNHAPFEYPRDGVATSPEEPPRYGAVRYADRAIGELFRLARGAEYFDRTVFLVVADHDTRVYGAQLVPIEKFHIPALVIAPGLAPRRYDGLASQVDLAPTVLGLLGITTEHPMPGRDLFQVPPDVPGHAFMQYDLTNAYRVADRVLIQEPRLPPKQFLYRDGRLTETALDPELARDALAQVQVAAMLYRERRHRLPVGGREETGPGIPANAE